MANIAYNLTLNTVTLFIEGELRVFNSDDINFNEIKEELSKPEHDVERLKVLCKPEVVVQEALSKVDGASDVKVTMNGVFYKGKPIHNTLTTKLLDLLKDGVDVTPWANFLNRIMKNPSYNSRESLFNFLEKFSAPLLPDGRFLAFKRVNHRMFDCYTDTFDNNVGQKPSVDRAEVDDNINNTCSKGLHVCASSYLKSYHNQVNARTIVVAVDPEDVVAVPADYNHAKMRVCKYEVLEEIQSTQDTYKKINSQKLYSSPALEAFQETYGEETCDWCDLPISDCECN